MNIPSLPVSGLNAVPEKPKPQNVLVCMTKAQFLQVRRIEQAFVAFYTMLASEGQHNDIAAILEVLAEDLHKVVDDIEQEDLDPEVQDE
jgi:hypothetical protein